MLHSEADWYIKEQMSGSILDTIMIQQKRFTKNYQNFHKQDSIQENLEQFLQSFRLMFSFTSRFLHTVYRGVSKIQLNIYDVAFCKNTWRLSIVNYFRKKLHLWCLAGSKYAFEMSCWIGHSAKHWNKNEQAPSQGGAQ